MPFSSMYPRPAFRSTAMWWAAVLLWALLIFWFSAQPDLRVARDELADFIVRKSGHVLVFFVLYLLLTRASHGRATLAWALTTLYAVSDEWHQTFVPGRVGHAQDVMIDIALPTLALFVARVRRSRTSRTDRS